MILSEKFVHIHLPKTGGTFVAQALRRVLKQAGVWSLDTSRRIDRWILGKSRYGQHEPVSEIPAEHRDKPVLTSIRNPFEWYVSHYEFAWWKGHPGEVFDDDAISIRFQGYPDLRFGEFVQAINDWRLLPQAWSGFAREMEAAGIGWLSWLSITRLAWDPEPILISPPRLAEGRTLPADSTHPEIHFLRTNTLNEDLYAFLLRQGFARNAVDFVKGLGYIYPKEGGRAPAATWRDYYDPDTSAFVRDREHILFDLFPEFDVQV